MFAREHGFGHSYQAFLIVGSANELMDTGAGFWQGVFSFTSGMDIRRGGVGQMDSAWTSKERIIHEG